MIYRILSALTSYPDEALQAALPEIAQALDAWPDARETLSPLTALLAGDDLIALQENYVATFDRNPAHSLHLFEHIHGESRDRGQAMVDLLDEYRRHGVEPSGSELPDHVPTFLEFLGTLEPGQASGALGDAIHVLAGLGARLARNGSPYAAVFVVLTTLTDVVPREMGEPPVRDMDEAMAAFGIGDDGVEPLLKPDTQHTLRFYPRREAGHPMGAVQ